MTALNWKSSIFCPKLLLLVLILVPLITGDGNPNSKYYSAGNQMGNSQTGSSATTDGTGAGSNSKTGTWPMWLPPDQILKGGRSVNFSQNRPLLSQQPPAPPVPNADLEVAKFSVGQLVRQTQNYPSGSNNQVGQVDLANSGKRGASFVPGAGLRSSGNAQGPIYQGNGQVRRPGTGTSSAVQTQMAAPQGRPKVQEDDVALDEYQAMPPYTQFGYAVQEIKVPAPRNLWRTPSTEELQAGPLIGKLAGSFDSDWMSIGRPQVMNSRQENLRSLIDPEHQKIVSQWNLSALSVPIPKDMHSVIKDMLLVQAVCPMEFTWQDMGNETWPRYIKRGSCINASPCSWPPGMKCHISKFRKIGLLKWECYEKTSVKSAQPGTVWKGSEQGMMQDGPWTGYRWGNELRQKRQSHIQPPVGADGNGSPISAGQNGANRLRRPRFRNATAGPNAGAGTGAGPMPGRGNGPNRQMGGPMRRPGVMRPSGMGGPGQQGPMNGQRRMQPLRTRNGTQIANGQGQLGGQGMRRQGQGRNGAQQAQGDQTGANGVSNFNRNGQRNQNLNREQLQQLQGAGAQGGQGQQGARRPGLRNGQGRKPQGQNAQKDQSVIEEQLQQDEPPLWSPYPGPEGIVNGMSNVGNGNGKVDDNAVKCEWVVKEESVPEKCGCMCFSEPSANVCY